MSTPAPTRPWTADDFLAWEREQDARYEWDGANVVAMTGARLRHNTVVGNLYRALYSVLPSGCRLFTETVKLRAGEVIRYPDLLMVCDGGIDLDTDLVDRATLVVEVLSPSTAKTDRGAKVDDYGRVPGLRAYLVVDPTQRALLLYRREHDQLLPAPAADVAGERATLFESVDLEVGAVYSRRCDFPRRPRKLPRKDFSPCRSSARSVPAHALLRRAAAFQSRA